jgi:aspartate-semialdehyde dehydrogenase
MQCSNVYVAAANAAGNDVVWGFDADSGWERDADVVWIIDEGNAEEWKDGNAYWLPPLPAAQLN